jgi:hypothetical protein
MCIKLGVIQISTTRMDYLGVGHVGVCCLHAISKVGYRISIYYILGVFVTLYNQIENDKHDRGPFL